MSAAFIGRTFIPNRLMIKIRLKNTFILNRLMRDLFLFKPKQKIYFYKVLFGVVISQSKYLRKMKILRTNIFFLILAVNLTLLLTGGKFFFASFFLSQHNLLIGEDSFDSYENIGNDFANGNFAFFLCHSLKLFACCLVDQVIVDLIRCLWLQH